MTSGSFHRVEISSILVNRGDRQRKELKGIDELSASIRDNGLINAILVTREDHRLVAGERRLSAVKALGWTHIPCQYQDEVPEEKLHILELEENIRREDLSWQDRVAAVEKYHAAQKSIDPTWTIESSAKELNVSAKDITEKLQIARAMKADPKIAEMQRLSIAKNFVVRSAERAKSTEEKLLPQSVTVAPKDILNASFIDWAASYTGPKFNLLHVDFPYGVNMQNSDQAASARTVQGDYQDNEKNYWELIEALGDYQSNFIDDQAHMLFWFSMKFYEETKALLREQGWTIDDFPVVWHKSDSAGILPDAQRGPRRVYETAFLCSHGDRKIVRAVDNTVSLPRGQTIHMSEKPVPVLTHFFRMLVDSSTTLLDPTCGSGSALRAAEALGAKRVFGIELNPDFATRASDELTKTRQLRSIAV